MGFWDKSLHIFKSLCDHGTEGVRRLAQQTGFSKSSVHRLTQAMKRRDVHPESWWWETEAGRRWLTRLVVATLYTFGLKRGVGLDTMSEFFVRLRLATQVGCSPSALRRVMQALEAALLETAGAWETEGLADGEGREIIGAVDETFLEQMLLVFMDLKTGYLLLEEVAVDRTYATWKVLVEERLTALGTHVLYMVSDRAKALIQLAEQGLECFSMPDFFHLMHEIVKSYSLALGRRMRHSVNHTKKEYARGEVHENRAECLFSLLKPYLRVFRGLSKTNLPGYVGFFQFLRNFHQLTACEQAEMILYAALDPTVASKARKGDFVRCLDHFKLLQSPIN